jgi:hypothetical protein
VHADHTGSKLPMAHHVSLSVLLPILFVKSH